MSKEEFENFQVVSSAFIFYKSIKHWVVGKDEEEGLLCIIENDNGHAWAWMKKMVRYENCNLN